MGLIYIFGNGAKVDYAKGIEYFKQSGEKGNYDAYNNLGNIYREGTGKFTQMTLEEKEMRERNCRIIWV